MPSFEAMSLQHAPERQITTSVLVIGTGGAGLRASIELAERGVQVLAVGKRRKHDAHTTLAAGGINAALATMDPEDSWQQHAADTLRESYFLADPAIVEVVTQGAAEGIADLERWWNLYSGMGVAKRIQAPPVLAVSRRAFGFDHREAQNPVHYTHHYLQLKSQLISQQNGGSVHV